MKKNQKEKIKQKILQEIEETKKSVIEIKNFLKRTILEAEP